MRNRDIKDKTGLVTGGSGFIGSALINKLVELGALVHSVSRNEPKNLGGATWHRGDLSDAAFTDSLIGTLKPLLNSQLQFIP
jgi:uncharacterized protein YbjT (DUF2867 family)